MLWLAACGLRIKEQPCGQSLGLSAPSGGPAGVRSHVLLVLPLLESIFIIILEKKFFFLSKLVFLRKPCFLFLRDSDGTGGRPASGQQEVAAAPPSRTCAAGRAPGHLVGGTGSTGGGLRGRRAGTGTCSQQHPREQTGPLQVHAHVCAWTPDLVIFVRSSPERRWTLSLHFDSCLNHLLGKS